ncbi:DUF4352 domain-containing protein [Streptomyces chryseus]|uniref:DUF4352 domain-containing protein n=1 Tax=Streptomyces chryseus TaxID=68186 RepID=UPI00142E9664|nr:DUF4352 domain-containing protein [Streptomyces chryseus]
MESDEYGENTAENTKFEVTVKSAKYVTPADVDTSEGPVNGQYVLLTLTVKNIGPKPGDFTSYGMIKWEDAKTAEQEATTLNITDGQDLDATYKPGQSVTGSLVLDVVRKGGTLSYWDELGAPAFTIKLPK